MQQQQKQLGSTYSTGANFSTTVVGNSATKSPNSSVDRKVINTLQIQPIDSRFCDTVKNCSFHSSLIQSKSKTEKMNPPCLKVGWARHGCTEFATPFLVIYKPSCCTFYYILCCIYKEGFFLQKIKSSSKFFHLETPFIVYY